MKNKIKFELDNMFVSVKEAAELTGKSATTIYRLCNKRINTEYVRKEDNKFFINKDFLMATYPPEEPEELSEIKDGELPEMRFENVIENSSVNNDIEEKPITLEKKETALAKNTEGDNESEIATGDTVVFEEDVTQSYYKQLTSMEVITGLSASLILVAIFIYLLSVLAN